MRSHVSSLALVLSSLSLAQAAAYDRRNGRLIGRQNAVETSGQNIAEGFMSMFNRVAGGGGQTVTETIRQTITVGGAGAAGAGLNATAVTVTVTAAASTVTVCPGQANGAVDGIQIGDSASAAPGGEASSVVAPPPAGSVAASGGVGVTVIAVPSEARMTSVVQEPPVTSDPVASSVIADASSTLVPPPADSQASQSDPGLAPPPGLSATDAATSLAPLPSLPPPPGLSDPGSSATSLSSLPPLQTPPALADPTSLPVVDAPASEPSSEATLTSAATSATSLAPLPGLASSLDSTINLGAGGGAAPTNVVPDAAFGGSAGAIPVASAVVPPAQTATPAVANGAGVGVTIDVSGLTLSSQINLGNLAQATPAAAAVVRE
ncbi:hypothetical protein MMYC01_200252 [Madurella mycetomatis]|uniref:Uncharacterized protein n=1 Tax=Madurella mycetomatis TaxID=100816 RepID=A0A175WKB6_9PEZI|nr:hypothetical protein MMYC01_200252 [Madurella mycetomatis]